MTPIVPLFTVSFRVGLVLAIFFSLISFAAAQTCMQPPSGMIAWWPLDETTGTRAREIIGNNTGTHVGGPVPATGAVDGALRFDGFDDYIVVPDSDQWALFK
jgi:hypothetical protein